MGKQIETFTVSRDDEIHERAPDVTSTESGDLVCVFLQDTHHASNGYWQIMFAKSYDRGRSWHPKQPLGEPLYHYPGETAGKSGNCPKVTTLSDGRVVAITATNVVDEGGNETVTTRLRVSHDEGETWDTLTEVPTDAVRTGFDFKELTRGPHSGRWIVTASPHDAEHDGVINTIVSDDGGDTWQGPFTVADEPELQLYEPDIVELPDGELVCFIREDSRTGMDAFKAISEDGGETWEGTYRMPIPACHRPMTGVLNSGNVLMTYRFEQGGKHHKHKNTYAALMDVESCLARSRDEAHTEIVQLDHDISYAGDSGYTGWTQFDDGEIYVVNYIKDDAPHLQVKEPEDFDGGFATAPKAHIRGYSIDEGHFLNRPLADFIEVADGVHHIERWLDDFDPPGEP